MKQLLRYLLVTAIPVWAQVSPAINGIPSREFGQPKLVNPLTTSAPNLLEGRELSAPMAVAFDTTVSPAILYVADTNNNRILAWRNSDGINQGNPADKVIGQRDFSSTITGGPGTSFVTGFAAPTGITVDRNGNLYVADAANNRILRFPPPFQQQGDLFPDLVIGQKTVSSGSSANEGQLSASAKTLALYRSGTPKPIGMASDAAGNLWVTDRLNHRILRYPVSQLAAGTIEPAADLVLGQFTFTSSDLPQSQNQTQRNKVAVIEPTGLAFDSRGGLYVADLFARVLYFANPGTSSGASATRVLGIQPTPAQGQQSPPYPTQYSLGFFKNGQQTGTPLCVFTFGAVVFVCDTDAHRIARYAAPEDWPAETNEAFSPPIAAVYGQTDFVSGMPNRGLNHSANNSLAGPSGGVIVNGDMWLADTLNNRVVAYPQGPQAEPTLQFPAANRVLGQVGFEYNAPNLVEGKELFISSGSLRGSSIVVDKTSTPNHLYIADSLNHRILGFRDVRTVGVDSRGVLQVPADGDLIIIGQPDRFHTTINYPSEDPLIPTDSGLFAPTGVAVDQFGNLYVGDTLNGRVVRFPKPFAQPGGSLQHADLVLGQPNFTTKIQQASASTMTAPYGVALFSNGDMAVADGANNRVLIFRRPGADFSSGQSAQVVLGQQNFNSSGSSNSPAGLNGPRGLAVDSSDRLYVADRNNNRLVIYGSTGNIPNGATGTIVSTNLSQPEGVAVSAASGEIWVASAGNSTVYRFNEFTQLLSDSSPTAQLGSATPIAVALDAFDNVIVAEGVNRMSFYYARLYYKHSANYGSGIPVTPNEIILLARQGKDFTLDAAQASSLPYPKELAGVQVLVDGVAAPIYRVDPAVIYAILPNAMATSGPVEFLVTRKDTGEILAAGTFTAATASPGFYTLNQAGTGLIAAINFDTGTINGPANPIDRNQILEMFLTGFGNIPGLPPDGTAPGQAISTTGPLTVILNAKPLEAKNILYSGVSPEFPGLWQINIRIPDVVSGGPAPGYNSVVVVYNDRQSNIVGTTTIGADRQMQPNELTSIYVK